MIMQAVLFLVRILGISVGVYYQDFMLGIIWFSIFNIFGYLAYQIVAFKSLGLRVKDVLKGYMFAFPVVFLYSWLRIKLQCLGQFMFSLVELLSQYYIIIK